MLRQTQGNRLKATAFSVQSLLSTLFGPSDDGFIIDARSLDRLFLLSTGATGNVTANDDPVGLALDYSQWQGQSLASVLAAQAELKGTGALANFGAGAAGSYDTVTGIGSLQRIDVNNRYDLQFATAATKTYVFDVENTSASAVISVRTNIGGISIDTISAGQRKTVYVQAVGTKSSIVPNTNGMTATFVVHSVKLVPGNHALQSTGANRILYKTGSGNPYFSSDGSNDALLTALPPALAGTMAFWGTMNAVSDVAMGSMPASDGRAFIGTDASGLLAAGIGAQDVTTIKGGASIIGVPGVGIVRWTGSVVTLFWSGAIIYQAAQSGAVNTTIALYLAALNNNGTPASHAAADFERWLYINRALTDSECTYMLRIP